MVPRSLASEACSGGSTSDLDWGTSFAFSAICTAASIILYFSPKGCHKVVPSYFLATGTSYAVLGLRQILHEDLSQGVREALEMASHVFYGLGSILLLVLSMLMVKITPRSESKVKMATFWLLISFLSGIMLVTIFLEAKMNSGVPLHASLSFGLLMVLMSVYMFHMCLDRTKVWHYIAKALAVFIIAIEVLYSTIIASMECEKCSATCQTSSGTDTNGVIHDVVLFFGFTILAWGEDNSPSVTAPGFNQYIMEGVVEDQTDAADTSVSDWVTSDDSDIEGSTYGDDQPERVLLGEEEKVEEREAEGAGEEVVSEKNHISSKDSDDGDEEEQRDSSGSSNNDDDEEVHDA